MGGQRERVRGQSRKLLYSIPTVARAATAELGIYYMSFFS